MIVRCATLGDELLGHGTVPSDLPIRQFHPLPIIQHNIDGPPLIVVCAPVAMLGIGGTNYGGIANRLRCGWRGQAVDCGHVDCCRNVSIRLKRLCNIHALVGPFMAASFKFCLQPNDKFPRSFEFFLHSKQPLADFDDK
jgi:hypothetical protein